MNPSIRALGCPSIALVVLLGCGCSWQRYDDITAATPVRILDAPSGPHGIGTSLATFRDKDGRALALSTGLDGFTVFDLSHSNVDALEQETCERSFGCFIAAQAASIRREIDGQETACAAYALTLRSDGTPSLGLYCDGQTKNGLALPEAAQTQIGAPSESQALDLVMTSGPRGAPRRLLVGIASKTTLVYFPSPSDAGVTLSLPDDAADSYGETLAVVDARFDGETGGATLIVGEPDAARLHLYAVDDAGAVATTACLSGPTDFGALLTVGHFADASSEGIAVGTLNEVTVLPSLAELGTLAAAADGCVAVEQLTQALRIDGAGLELDTSSDDSLSLGSLAPADLDADGTDELLVGAPTATANGERSAGLVLTVSYGDELVVHDRLSPSSAESDDRLGESVLGVPISGRDVVLAGAPGGNKLAAFYCSVLLPDALSGKRCQ